MDLEESYKILRAHILMISQGADILAISSGDKTIAVNVLKSQINECQIIIGGAKAFKTLTTPKEKLEELSLLAETLKDEDIEMTHDDLATMYSQDEINYMYILASQKQVDELLDDISKYYGPPLHYSAEAKKTIKKGRK